MRILFLIYVLLSTVNMFAQIEFTSEKHVVNIVEGKVVDHIFKKGRVTDSYGTVVSIKYSALETISDVELIYTLKKTKKVKGKSFIKTSLNTSSFFKGMNALQYKISEPADFSLSYKNELNDLMFLSTLNFYSYYKCDSIIYELVMPNAYYLFYDIPYEINGLEIDSVITSTTKKYTFKLFKGNVKSLADSKPSNSSFIVNNNVFKMVRVSLCKDKSPNQVLNDWYQQLTLSVGTLNKNSELLIDSIFNSATANKSEVEALYIYVQDKIRYLDIEDGISAFKPRNVNDILANKQGDCKDMANLLTQALVYKGYDAHMALSSSLSHRLPLDFPNIASANHVVCVLKLDGEWIVLDATDKYCLFLNPSSHTQNKNIFIIGDSIDTFYKVKTISYLKNLDSTYSQTIINKGLISSVINVSKVGLSNRSIYLANKRYTNQKFNDWVTKGIKNDYPSYKLKDLKVNVSKAQSIIAFSNTQKTKSIVTIKNKNYLAIRNLLLFPNDYALRINAKEKLITYETIYKKQIVVVSFDENIKLLDEIKETFKQDNFSFNFTAKQLNGNTLELVCTLIIDEVEIRGKSISAYNNMNEIITKSFNKSIIYETLEK